MYTLQGWSWHNCHQHWHYDNYAHYALRTLCNDSTVAWEDRPVVGHKNGWGEINTKDMVRHAMHSLSCPTAKHRCVSDVGTYGPNGNGGRCNHPSDKPYLPLGLHDFTCMNMGISSGCSDVYHSGEQDAA